MLGAKNSFLRKLYQVRFPRNGVTVSGTREYSAGDDTRLINWKLSAKTSNLHVNTLSIDSGNDVIFVVDTSSSMAFSTEVMTKFDIAADIVVKIGQLAETCNDKIGTIVFANKINGYQVPGHASGGLKHMLRKEFHQYGSTTDLLSAIKFINKVIKKRSNIIIITDMFGLSINRKNVLSELHILRSKHDVTVVCITDGNDIVPIKIGKVALEDHETGETIEVDTKNLGMIEEIRKKFSNYSSIVMNDISELGIRMIEISTKDDTKAAIRKILNKRPKHEK